MNASLPVVIRPKKELSPQQKERMAILARAALEMAGFKASDLRKAMRRTREAMDAEEIIVSQKGKVVRSPKHSIRLAASKEVFELADAYPAKSRSVQAGGTGNTMVVEVVTLASDGSRTVTRVGIKGEKE